MGLETPVVWSDLHALHRPKGEIWVGVRTPGTELPERAERIREALLGSGAPFVEAQPAPDETLLEIHERSLLDYLAAAWDEWSRSGLVEDPGQDRVVPYLFPHPGLGLAGEPPIPAAASARAGRFTYDTMTLIGPGTWEAARAAVDAAVSAAALVAAGAPAGYALTRPPGHHATRSAFGGSCYLNNCAAAAAHLRRSLSARIAVLDLDAHHGNGTQEIFSSNPDVLTGSVHVDPAAGWFPHFLGFADEEGSAAGAGANRNLPLAPGSGDSEWLGAISTLGQWAADGGAGALVVALGVDAASSDPEAPLEVSAAAFRAAGRELGALGLPTVIVQEGGYDLETIGSLVVEFLEGLEQGRGAAQVRSA